MRNKASTECLQRSQILISIHHLIANQDCDAGHNDVKYEEIACNTMTERGSGTV
jgi:hypothetical protein